MSTTNEFINIYKQVEQFANSLYGIDPDIDRGKSGMKMLEWDKRYERMRNDIAICRRVRNLYSHSPKKREMDLVEVSDETIRILKEVLHKLENPVTAEQLMIRQIYTREITDNVYEAMKVMRNNTYTHIPIVENGILKGVFSENTIFSYLIDNEIMAIEPDTTFEEFSSLLPCDKHKSEDFIFMKKKTTLYDIEKKISDSVKQRIRIGMIFVTENGKQTEKLLGIITPWDMIGK